MLCTVGQVHGLSTVMAISAALRPHLKGALRGQGLEALYAHQTHAIERQGGMLLRGPGLWDFARFRPPGRPGKAGSGPIEFSMG